MIDQIIFYASNVTFNEFLLILLGILIVSVLIGFFSKSHRIIRKLKRIEKKEYEELKNNKCEGPHTWLKMKIRGNETHVCKECYWAPEYETFVKKHFVKAELENIKFEDRLKKHFEDKVKEIANYHEVDGTWLLARYEEIGKIKKEFTIDYIEKKLLEALGAGNDGEF